MPIQSLPCEIVTAVIECLSWKGDLSSISLTSTYFLELARPMLFANIRLPVEAWPPYGHYGSNSSRPRDYLNEFIAFLTSAPHLAFLIRELMLQSTSDPQHFPNRNLLAPELLHDMLSRLPSLRGLHLDVVAWRSTHIPVSFRYDTIDYLTISYASGPWDVKTALAFFSHIRKLSLSFRSDNSESQYSLNALLQMNNISNIFPEDLQVFNLRLAGKSYRELEVWTDMARQTPTSKVLQSLSLYCEAFSHECRPSSIIFDLLREAAPTLQHLTLGTGSKWETPHGQSAFDSQEMCDRLAPLTSLRSLTLNFILPSTDQFETIDSIFARMVQILASLPPHLRHITLFFARRFLGPPGLSLILRPSSWLARWPDVNLRLLVPLLHRYQELETITFKGPSRPSQQAHILAVDLPEFQRLIRFVTALSVSNENARKFLARAAARKGSFRLLSARLSSGLRELSSGFNAAGEHISA